MAHIPSGNSGSKQEPKGVKQTIMAENQNPEGSGGALIEPLILETIYSNGFPTCLDNVFKKRVGKSEEQEEMYAAQEE